MLLPSVGDTRDKTNPFLVNESSATHLLWHLCFLFCDLRMLPAIELLTNSGLDFEFGFSFFFIFFLERQLDPEKSDKPQIFMLSGAYNLL